MSERRGRITLVGLVECGALVTGLATVAGFLAPFGWYCELTSHFRAQYFALLLVAVLIFGIVGRKRSSIACILFAAINALLIAPLYLHQGPDAVASGATFRALHINVHTANRQFDAVLDLVAQNRPDFILFEEVDAAWIAHLAPIESDYPHRIAQPRSDNFGIALYSKLPMENAQVVKIGTAGVPSVRARIQVGRTFVTVIGTHPVPPTSAEHVFLRNEQLDELATLLAAAPRPALLLGDLNTTPWSGVFQKLLSEGRLHNSARGRGIQPTWPANLWPLLIPLDHCLYTDGLIVTDRHLGPYVGSDHYPLICDFAITG